MLLLLVSPQQKEKEKKEVSSSLSVHWRFANQLDAYWVCVSFGHWIVIFKLEKQKKSGHKLSPYYLFM